MTGAHNYPAAHGVIMGVDYGDSRTGIAVSDADCRIAFGVTCIKAKGMRAAVNLVAEEARKRRAVRIVVGLPLNMDDTEGPRAERARVFAGMLADAASLPVDLWDERLTTVEAYDIMDQIGIPASRRRDTVDTIAAQVILQSYLDAKK